MSTRTLLIAAASVTALTLTACTPSHHHPVPKPTSKAVVADEAQAKKDLQHCLPADILSLSSASARKAFTGCLKVPAAKQPAFDTCLTAAAEHDRLLTRAGRAKFTEVAAPKCYEAAR